MFVNRGMWFLVSNSTLRDESGFSGSRTVLFSVFLLLLALAPRLEWVSESSRHPLYSDMEDFYATAVNYAEGRGLANGHLFAYRPPLYPLVMGLFFKYIAHSVRAFLYVQAVVGSVSCVLLFLLARRLCGCAPSIHPSIHYMLVRGGALHRRVSACPV